jgi:hypothetical protein
MRVGKIAKNDYWFRHVRLSFRLEQLGSQWTDFRENWYWSIFRKPVEKVSFIKVGQK